MHLIFFNHADLYTIIGNCTQNMYESEIFQFLSDVCWKFEPTVLGEN